MNLTENELKKDSWLC